MASPTPIGTNGTFTATVSGTTATTVSTYTVPAGGQNKTLHVILATELGNNGRVSGITWNGVSMNFDVSVAGVNAGGGMAFSLPAPAVGNNNLVISYSASPGEVYGLIFTMQNEKQSGALDVTAANTTSAGSVSQTNSVTTTVDNDVVIGWVILGNGATSISSNVGTSLGAITEITSLHILQASYIAKTTAGSQSMTFNWTGSVPNDMFATSYKYQAPSIVTTGNFLMFN